MNEGWMDETLQEIDRKEVCLCGGWEEVRWIIYIHTSDVCMYVCIWMGRRRNKKREIKGGGGSSRENQIMSLGKAKGWLAAVVKRRRKRLSFGRGDGINGAEWPSIGPPAHPSTQRHYLLTWPDQYFDCPLLSCPPIHPQKHSTMYLVALPDLSAWPTFWSLATAPTPYCSYTFVDVSCRETSKRDSS